MENNARAQVDWSCKHSILLQNDDGSFSPMDEPYFRSELVAPGTWKVLSAGDYSYLVEGENEAVSIDTGYGAGNIRRYLQSLTDKPVKNVINTHSHFDHILGIPDLRKVWPDLPVYCHPDDVDEDTLETEIFGMRVPTVASFGNIRTYQDGDVLTVAGVEVKVLHTPGHTPGSCVLMAGDVLFTGDTLFKGSVGRTDLEGGDSAAMMGYLQLLAGLKGDWQVLPGHEGRTTLEQEKHTNPYLRLLAR